RQTARRTSISMLYSANTNEPEASQFSKAGKGVLQVRSRRSPDRRGRRVRSDSEMDQHPDQVYVA
ncbi:MAG: hypothetical protein LW720_01415, partial [Pirellula sp.]|nr:hypothetical protein [Pirellula sp.]